MLKIILAFWILQITSSLILFQGENFIVIDTYAQSPTNTNETYQFVKELGSYGSEIGKFNTPRGIAIDSKDNIYVADTYNDRIQKFDSNGNFIKQWNLVNVHGSHPLDIFIDNEEKLNVLYQSLNYGVPSKVQQFDFDGNHIADSYASLDDFKIEETHTTAINSTGFKFSIDIDRNTIQIFSPIVNNSSSSEHNETLKPSLPIGITDQI